MAAFPLQHLIHALAHQGIFLSPHDYRRLQVLVATGSVWTPQKLANVTSAMLAKSPGEQHRFTRDLCQALEETWEAPEATANGNPAGTHSAPSGRRECSAPPPGREEGRSRLQRGLARLPLPFYVCLHLLQSLGRVLWFLTLRHYHLLLIVLTVAYVADQIFQRVSQWSQQRQETAHLKVDPTRLFMGEVEIGAVSTQDITLTNSGNTRLELVDIFLQDPQSGFSVVPPKLPKQLAAGAAYVLKLSFAPLSAGSFQDVLVITYGNDLLVQKVTLTGKGGDGAVREERQTTLPGSTGRRLVNQVPRLTVDLQAMPTSRTWHPVMVFAIGLYLLFIVYFLYIWRLEEGPPAEVPSWDPEGPAFFDRARIGGPTPEYLDPKTAGLLAEYLEYVTTHLPGRNLDGPSSVRATLKRGGIPWHVLQRLSRVRAVLILEDTWTEALANCPLPRELARGLRRHGVVVHHVRFGGRLNQAREEDGRPFDWTSPVDEHLAMVTLLFSDGYALDQQELQLLAAQPLKAWIDPRQPRFWPDPSGSKPRFGFPVFPATNRGLLAAFHHLHFQEGERQRAQPPRPLLHGLPQVDLEQLLGPALAWAADCAMIQPITPALAQALRVRFHPHLSADQLHTLLQLQDTSQSLAGIRFSGPVLKHLRGVFLARRTSQQQREVLEFILAAVEAAEPDCVPEGLAYLSWEAVRERVRLELTDAGLSRFGQLLQSPLAPFLHESLAGHGFADQRETIPLRVDPQNPLVAHTLRQLRDNPLKIAPRRATSHRVGLVVVGLILFWVLTSLFNMDHTPDPVFQVGAGADLPAQLEFAADNNPKWQTQPEVRTVADLVGITPKPGNYRLSLFGASLRDTVSFLVDGRTDIRVDATRADGMHLPCAAQYPEVGLRVLRCPGSLVAGGVMDGSWKDRTGDLSPLDYSVGLLVLDSRTLSQELVDVIDLLLATRSLDLMYLVEPDREGNMHLEEVLDIMGTDLRETAGRTQLLKWGAGARLMPRLAEFPDQLHFTVETDSWAGDVLRLFNSGTAPILISPSILPIDPRLFDLALVQQFVLLPQITTEERGTLVWTSDIDDARLKLTHGESGAVIFGDSSPLSLAPGSWLVLARGTSAVSKTQAVLIQRDRTTTAAFDAEDPADHAVKCSVLKNHQGIAVNITEFPELLFVHDRDSRPIIFYDGSIYFRPGKITLENSNSWDTSGNSWVLLENGGVWASPFPLALLLSQENSSARSVSLSGNHKMLAVGTTAGTTTLYALEKKLQATKTKPIKTLPSGLFSLDFDLDDHFIVASDGTTVKRFPVAPSETGFETLATNIEANVVTHIPAGPLRGTVACATDTGTVHLLGASPQVLRDSLGRIYDLKFNRDGTYMVTTGDTGSTLWRLEPSGLGGATYVIAQSLDQGESIDMVSFIADTGFLLTSGKHTNLWTVHGQNELNAGAWIESDDPKTFVERLKTLLSGEVP